MSRIGEKLLSKVIKLNDPQAFIRYGIEERHFTSETTAKAYRFIKKYAEENNNQAPSYLTVVEETGLNYEEDVDDTYEYLVRELKKEYAEERFYRLLSQRAKDKYQELDGIEFGKWLVENALRIIEDSDTRNRVGVDIKTVTERFLEEYRNRKEGRSIKTWRSSFETIRKTVGDYTSGNMYTWYGRSGRGKSAITLREGVEAALQGANVLIWAMEMPEYEVLSRIFTFLSAIKGVQSIMINGKRINAGFDNRELMSGSMGEMHEEALEEFLKRLNEMVEGNIYVRAVDHEDFTNRTVRELERDILATEADVVIIDPFYYMHYEKNTNNTTGGAAEKTSQALRHLAGRTKTVLHVITQASETKDERSESGIRILRAPRRSEIKKTSAVLEDAALTLGIDTLDGEGIIELGKGRTGGEGTEIHLLYMPTYGIIQEMPTGEEAASHFSGSEDF